MISAAAMIAGLGANIYNRESHWQDVSSEQHCLTVLSFRLFLAAISQIESDLHATPSQLSLTLSLFILIQGGFPVIWSAVSEIQGRKV